MEDNRTDVKEIKGKIILPTSASGSKIVEFDPTKHKNNKTAFDIVIEWRSFKNIFIRFFE